MYRTKTGKILTDSVIEEFSLNAEFSHILDEIFAEIETESYFVGIAIERAAKDFDLIFLPTPKPLTDEQTKRLLKLVKENYA